MGRTWRFAYVLALALGLLVGARWSRAEIMPEAAPGRAVYLPVLHYVADASAGVETLVQVQNLGAGPTRVAMFVWAEYSGSCAPQAPGPFKRECSGILQPGSAWVWTTAQLPASSKSAVLYPVSDCPSSLTAVPGLLTHEPLAAHVLRRAPVSSDPNAHISASYPGIPDWMLGTYDESFGGFGYYAPLIRANPAGFSTWLYIQNGGDVCTSVELWFKAQDDCLRAQICDVASLAPGETYQFDAGRCIGPGFRGSAWIRSSQPLAVVVDEVSSNLLMSYIGRPVQLDAGWAPVAIAPVGSQVLYGPLVYREQQGWDSTVQVQNLSSVLNAKVKVYFLDNSGNIITSLVDWICPRGSQTFFLPVVNNLRGNYTGQIRVESLNWLSPGDPSVPASNILAVAELIRYEGPARGQALEGIAYNLIPEWEAFDWQDGEISLFDTGLVGVTSLNKMGVGSTTELAIENVVPLPGYTDFAILIYDQNGLIDYQCHKLNARQSEYVNFDTWGFLNPGFRGSAVISATYWTHETASRRRAVGLAAIQVERSGTALGVDIPGDASSGSEGIPMPRWWATQWGTPFSDPRVPRCPGQP
jgi:hypothetical protein